MFKMIENRNKFVLIIMFVIVLITLTGCTNNEENIFTDKVLEELNLLENNIFDVVRKYVSGTYEKNIINEDMLSNIIDDTNINISELEINVIDFNELKKDLVKINKSLDINILDLTEKHIENNSIVSLTKGIDEMFISLDSENINEILVMLNNLEKSVVSNFEKVITENNNDEKSNDKYKNYINTYKLKKLKSDVLNVLIEFKVNSDKEKSKSLIKEIEKDFLKEIENKEFVNDNQYIINNIYILLEEFKVAIEAESEELVDIKYLSLIELL